VLQALIDLEATQAIGAVTEAAASGGVRRLVLLSGRREPAARRCEEIVVGSGLEWTVVRASWFAQNFDEGHLLGPVLDGVVALPAADVPEPFVDAADVAEVAVAALTGDGHAGRVYEVTGPETLTFAEATAVIGAAAGRPVRHRAVGPAEYRGVLVGHGVPEHEAAMLTDLVGQALGRAPRTFADYARAAAATGVWSLA
jgi:uncharacterized protein YbjT (DUF2867 family)